MIKVIGLLKRRAGMSVDEFRTYYESQHRLIGEKYLSGHASRYIRRYLNPQDRGLSDEESRPYDVILEIWYPDQTASEAASARLSLPEAIAEIVADEEQLFDRQANRFFTVEEVESDL
ncbi:MAG: EthD domain-containing protein [Pseudomonadota bacterium]